MFQCEVAEAVIPCTARPGRLHPASDLNVTAKLENHRIAVDFHERTILVDNVSIGDQEPSFTQIQ